MKDKFQLCSFCGKNKATTKDHLPPKAIFNKPLPSDLITVPSCFECNNNASKHDESFKTYLSLHVAKMGGEAERLFKERGLSTTKHNNRLRRDILKNMSPVFITTKAGIIVDKAMSVLWDSDAHDATIERIVRGLFFYHYKKIIADRATIQTYWFDGFPYHLPLPYYEVSIADGNFKYHYDKVDDGEFDSIWIFNFYNGHFAGGIVFEDESIEKTSGNILR